MQKKCWKNYIKQTFKPAYFCIVNIVAALQNIRYILKFKHSQGIV